MSTKFNMFNMLDNYYTAFIPLFNFNQNVNVISFSKKKTLQKKTLQKQMCVNFFTAKFNKNFSKKTVLFVGNHERNPSEIIQAELKATEKEKKYFFRKSLKKYKTIISILIVVVLLAYYLVPLKNKYKLIATLFVLSGTLFFIIIKKNFTENKLDIKQKILELVSLDSTQLDFKKIESELKKKFNVDSENLKKKIIEIYKAYVLLFLREPHVKTNEIEDLIRIKKNFEISSQEIGECHAEIACELYKKHIVDTERNASEYSSSKINKFIFLSDRIFSTDSPKGYQYELAKLRKILSLSIEEISSICSTLSCSSYAETVDFLFKKGICNLKNLNNVQMITGINKENKEKFHTTFIEDFLLKTMEEKKKITKDDVQKIEKSFEINEKKFKGILFDTIKPALYSEITKCINEWADVCPAKQDLEKAAKKFSSKIQDFPASSFQITEVISNILKKTTQDITSSAIKDLHAQKISCFLEQIETLFKLEENCLSILKSVSQLNKDEIYQIHTNSFYNLNRCFEKKELIRILEFFFKKLFEEFLPTPDKEGKLMKIKNFFSISDQEYETVKNNITEPIFEKKIIETIESDNSIKEKIDRLKFFEMSLKLKKNSVFSIKIKIYKKYLEDYMKSDNILSAEKKIQLNKIKNTLLLKWSDVQQIYDNTNEIFYKKAVLEAMGASGFISTDYWASLEKLRKKIKMTEGQARGIFYQTSKDKMKYIFEQTLVEHKKKIQPKNEIKEDINPVLGIESDVISGNELSGLIDFYNRNKIFSENESSSKISSKEYIKGLTGRLETKLYSKVQIDYIYPISLKGLFDDKIILEIYKQYLIECFSSKFQNEKRKLFTNLEKLGPILGIKCSDIKSIHINVGSSVYTQFLRQALVKGFVDKSETTFLRVVKNTLEMDNSKCLELLKQAKKNRIKAFVENIIGNQQKIDLDKTSEMRKMASRLRVDLRDDWIISTDGRDKLFRMEIDSGIEKGLINNENQSLIEELRVDFGLSKEATNKLLLECITTKCEEYLINSVALLRKNTIQNSINELKKMMKIGKILPIRVQSSFITNAEKNQLFSAFQNIQEEETEVKSLKIMLNL